MENENRGRTFSSIESPMTNKNILSFTSFSPSSIMESSFVNKGASLFSQFSAYALQQNPSSLALHKTDSLREPADASESKPGEKMIICNSLTSIDESTKNSSQMKSRDFPKSLSFLPNYENEDRRDHSINSQQFKLDDYLGRIGELVETPSGSK